MPRRPRSRVTVSAPGYTFLVFCAVFTTGLAAGVTRPPSKGAGHG